MVRALKAPHSRHAMLRLRGNAARASLWLDTLPKVAALCFPNVRLHDKRQDGYVLLPNGSEIWIGGLDDKERVEKILGQEYSSLFFNECSQIPYSSVLMALTRLAQTIPGLPQRAYYDLNPSGTRHWSHKIFVEGVDPDTRRPLRTLDEYKWAYCNPLDNADNLTPEYLAELEALPERARKRFFEGVYSAEIDGALWTYETIDHARCQTEDVPADLRRVVVAVDPSGTAGDEDTRSDNIGIVVAGLANDGTGYVLADRTCNLPPEGWARIAANAYREFKADRIVAEKNFGGDMVRAVIHTVDQNIPVHLVTASRGKAIRAEPVSALYGFHRDGQWQKDRVRHAGDFRELEDQLLNFSTSGYLGHRSPDRADALIWALSELMVTEAAPGMNVFEIYRRDAEKRAAEKEAAIAARPQPEPAMGSPEWFKKYVR